MGLQQHSIGTATLQTKTNNPRGACFTTRLAMGRLLGHQGNETTLLIVQHQVAVGCPPPLGGIPMAVQPGFSPATQPAAQQPIGEHIGGRRGVTHGETLEPPTAKS